MKRLNKRSYPKTETLGLGFSFVTKLKLFDKGKVVSYIINLGLLIKPCCKSNKIKNLLVRTLVFFYIIDFFTLKYI